MKFGVVGLGLIGGSIFKSLTALGYDVIAVSKSQKGQNIYAEKNALVGCELIFVCSNMNNLINELDELEQYTTENTVVCDVSSLKGFVANLNYKFNFIPTHPMAGTEFSGYENSFVGLFEGAKWVVTKDDIPTKLTQIINDLGAKLVIMAPEEHDKAVALISHMPLVLSQALFKTVEDNYSAKLLAASGFRDMTRLALSNEQMACDMVGMNSKNIQDAFLKLYSSIGELLKENYPKQTSEIKQKRVQMYSDGKNVIK